LFFNPECLYRQALSRGTALAKLLAEVPMKPTTWNLIVISPDSPSLQKIRISATAVFILTGAFVLAFCTTVFLLLMFPHVQLHEQAHEIDRSRLAAENQVLRMENRDLTLGIRKLDSDVSHLEGRSQRVAALMEAN
jgi:hypothetical protein